jgi:hypothetical protein
MKSILRSLLFFLYCAYVKGSYTLRVGPTWPEKRPTLPPQFALERKSHCIFAMKIAAKHVCDTECRFSIKRLILTTSYLVAENFLLFINRWYIPNIANVCHWTCSEPVLFNVHLKLLLMLFMYVSPVCLVVTGHKSLCSSK